jgi:ribosomal-protein-alanine N-acetyltransferase
LVKQVYRKDTKQLEKFQKNIKDDSNYRFAVFEKKSGKLLGYTLLMDVSRGIFQNAYFGAPGRARTLEGESPLYTR